MIILNSRDIASLGIVWIWGHQAFTPMSEVAPVAESRADNSYSQDVLLARNLPSFGWTGFSTKKLKHFPPTQPGQPLPQFTKITPANNQKFKTDNTHLQGKLFSSKKKENYTAGPTTPNHWAGCTPYGSFKTVDNKARNQT